LERERDRLLKRNQDLGLLNRIGQGLVGSLKADELAQAAIRDIAALVSYELLALAWLPQERVWSCAAEPKDNGRLGAYQRGTLEQARIYAGPFSPVAPAARLSADGREVEVALLASGQCLGLLRLLRGQALMHFDTYETELLSALGNSLALALRGADAHEQVQSLAITDDLTSLLNRRAFSEVFHREFKKAARYQQSLGLLMIDIDHFKTINDQFGHQVGDSVLRQLAAYLGQTIRAVDVAARYGGEEFAILMPEGGMGHPLFAAERIRHAILDHTFLPKSRDYRVTVSIGVAQYKGEGGCHPDDLLRDADIALYRAKTNGRNRVEAAGLAGALFHPASRSLQPTVQ
jgi:diguanylate cyclase (GGDEF)-like protein